MADLSALGNLNPVEPIDMSAYAEVKASTFRLPVAGIYTLQAPESFPQAAYGRTKKGALSIAVDPTVIGPSNEGFTVRFTKVSATVFKRDGRNVSQVGDYLKACGVTGAFSSEQELADAVEQTAGKVYQAKLDWKVYNTNTGFSLKGMHRFPKLEDGSYQSWVEDPSEKDAETGKPKRLRANIEVDKYISQTN